MKQGEISLFNDKGDNTKEIIFSLIFVQIDEFLKDFINLYPSVKVGYSLFCA